MDYEEIQAIAAVAVTKYAEGKNKMDIAVALQGECNLTAAGAMIAIETIDRYVDQHVPTKPIGFDDGVLVYLKEELDDDRYLLGTKLRTGQIGFITGQRNPTRAFSEEQWVWVTWYAGPNTYEAAQCHRTAELGVVKTHAPFKE